MRRSGEDERWREGVANRKLWKERTERVALQYFTIFYPCTAGNKEEEHTLCIRQCGCEDLSYSTQQNVCFASWVASCMNSASGLNLYELCIGS